MFTRVCVSMSATERKREKKINLRDWKRMTFRECRPQPRFYFFFLPFIFLCALAFHFTFPPSALLRCNVVVVRRQCCVIDTGMVGDFPKYFGIENRRSRSTICENCNPASDASKLQTVIARALARWLKMTAMAHSLSVVSQTRFSHAKARFMIQFVCKVLFSFCGFAIMCTMLSFWARA